MNNVYVSESCHHLRPTQCGSMSRHLPTNSLSWSLLKGTSAKWKVWKSPILWCHFLGGHVFPVTLEMLPPRFIPNRHTQWIKPWGPSLSLTARNTQVQTLNLFPFSSNKFCIVSHSTVMMLCQWWAGNPTGLPWHNNQLKSSCHFVFRTLQWWYWCITFIVTQWRYSTSTDR